MKRIKEERPLDETLKKGLCLFELRRASMAQWGTSRRVTFTGKDENPQLSSGIVKKEEEEEFDDKEAVKAELPLGKPEVQKRKRIAKWGESAEQSKSSYLHTRKQTKLDRSKDRWSAERYKIAEQNMFEVMKAEGAVFESPISRPALRTAARKRIGDTGLLDHLLKHIDGRVAPGGTERFRRCYNTSGVMEYWLESADMVSIRRESGMLDPNWVPPSFSKACGAEEVKLLKAEMDSMKR